MVTVVDDWGFAAPRRRTPCRPQGPRGRRRERVLVVLDRDDEAAWKSFRNLAERVDLVSVDELNTYDVLVADRVIFTSATL